MRRHILAKAMPFWALSLLLSTAASAAVLNETFESYTLDQTLVSQNSAYSSTSTTKGTIRQYTGDTVNGTKVLEHANVGTASIGTTFTAPSAFTGDVPFQLDFKVFGSAGYTQIYVTPTSTDRPLWIQIDHANSKILLAREGAAANFPVLGTLQTGQWYRIQATMHLNAADGSLSTVDAALYTLGAGGVVGSLVGSQTAVNVRGAPTQGTGSLISTASGAYGVFDNWQIGYIPEPATLALLTLPLLWLGRPSRA